MTDQELNEAVAVKLGWTQETMNSFYLNYWKNPKTKLYSREPEDYCTDIKAAWEIIPQLGLHITLGITITGNVVAISATSMGETWVLSQADTAPMAIVKAFLKLDNKSL